MKRKIVTLVCVLAMTSIGFGDVVIGDYEGGSDDGWWPNDWDNVSAISVEANASTGTWSYETTVLGIYNDGTPGGWVPAIETALLGTEAQTILGSQAGLVSVDVTTFTEDFLDDYCELAIVVNTGLGEEDGWAGTWWNAHDYHAVVLGTSQTVVFDIPADARAAIAGATGWANIGILSSTAANVIDEFSGEPVYDSVATYYFDNVQVIVPEPATLALLGIGALSLIRRKR